MAIHKHDNQANLDNFGQVMFNAYNSVTDTDVTGNSTIFPIVCDVADYDVGSNYNNTTGLFTAPVTGKYQFEGTIYISGLTASHTIIVARLEISSGKDAVFNVGNGANIRDANNVLAFSFSHSRLLTAAQTVGMSIEVRNGTKVVDVLGNATVFYTCFSGALIG